MSAHLMIKREKARSNFKNYLTVPYLNATNTN